MYQFYIEHGEKASVFLWIKSQKTGLEVRLDDKSANQIWKGGEFMELTKRIATAVASGVIVFNTFATPAFAATIQITGNGSESSNNANVNITQTTTVVQNNVANITNNVDSSAKTGGNDANKNNGGNVTIDTGNATTKVSVSNTANSNTANVSCCPAANNLTVNVSNNADNTTNDANLNLTSATTLWQDNYAKIKNNVDADSKTGGNDANKNNGGDVEISTGNATTNVTVNTVANVNSAQVGNGNGTGHGNGGSLSLWITGNASDSTNTINADLLSVLLTTQANNARVYNNVDADASTGYNDANKNNGGNVTIDTGDASSKATVDNMVNFNFAAADCGCLIEDWTAKIGNNADSTDNKINLDLVSVRDNFQDNLAKVKNKLEDVDAKTGGNDANKNNGGAGHGDPEIMTGNATADNSVSNTVNTNSVNDGATLTLPGDLGVQFSFNWSMFLALLSLLH